MNLRPAPSTTALLTRRPHRLLTTQAFRSDDFNAARSASTVRLQPQARPAGMYHADMDPQPLWKKPSFPFVVAIALATLPYDLASQHIHPRHSKARSSATSTSSGTSEPRRHAKAAGHSPAVSTPAPAPRDITAVKREAAAAAAAVGQGSQHQRPHSSSTSQTRKPSTSQHSEPWPLAAVGSGGMGVPAHPVDSWDSGDAGVSGFSDDEAEQQAKAMVIELLTHPKDTEDAMMRAAAAHPGSTDSSGGRPVSVSPEYIDALVHAVQDPSMGMPHHQPVAPDEPPKSFTPSDSSGSIGGPGAEEAPASSSSPRRRRRQPSNASLWSWMDASPRSSQEEF